MDSTNQPDTSATPTQINSDALMAALANVDITGGVDLESLLGLQNNPEEYGKALRGVMQQTQMNTIQTMVSLINPLIQQAMKQTRESAVTDSRNSVTVDSVVTAFRNTHSYASNPVMGRMLHGMADALVKTAPAGTTNQQMVDLLHTTFSGMTAGFGNGQNENGPNIPAGAQTDFSGTFSQR